VTLGVACDTVWHLHPVNNEKQRNQTCQDEKNRDHWALLLTRCGTYDL